MNIRYDESIGLVANTIVKKHFTFHPLYAEDVPCAVGNMINVHIDLLSPIAYNVKPKKKAPGWLSRFFGAAEYWDASRVGEFSESLTLKGRIIATMVSSIYAYLKEQKDAQLSLPF